MNTTASAAADAGPALGGPGAPFSRAWANVALGLAVLTMLGLVATAAWQHGAGPFYTAAPAPSPASLSVRPAAPPATPLGEPPAGWHTPPNLLQEESR